MSGHSKWSQIKHKKGIEDKKRGQIFSKLSRIITLAAKEKGTDPNMNPSLRSAIEKAQAANMPKDNIARAVEKAGGGEQGFLEMIVEAYGPGGAALLIKAITDNKNRTIQELRHILSEHDGRMAGEGSVQWLFNLYGVITPESEGQTDQEIEMAAIESGAQDIQHKEVDGQKTLLILTRPDELNIVRSKLETQGIKIESSELDFIPKTPLPKPEPEINEKLDKLFEALDNHDDVQEIYSNIN